jgi:hypothetical protein
MGSAAYRFCLGNSRGVSVNCRDSAGEYSLLKLHCALELARGLASANLKSSFKGPQIIKSRFKRYMSNLVIPAHQESLCPVDSHPHQPVPETNSNFLMEERGKVFPFYTRYHCGSSEGNMLGIVLFDILLDPIEPSVVVERLFVDLP